MKTVGIILREWRADYKQYPLYAVKTDLIKFLRKYNINIITIPIMFENKNEFEKIKEVINLCDGIILPGGAEINDIEYKLTKYLYDIDKPTLGICLGMQTMGKTFNGLIRKRVEKENHNKDDEYVHNIKINENSLLYKILGENIIKVNSRHDNYIPHTNISDIAYSEEDNILEAIEDKNKRFFIGVQWHPETLINDKYSNKLFDYFIKSL